MPVESLLFHTSACFRFFFVLFLPFFSLTAPSSSTARSRAAVLLTAGRFLQWVRIGSFRSSSVKFLRIASLSIGSPCCSRLSVASFVLRLHLVSFASIVELPGSEARVWSSRLPVAGRLFQDEKPRYPAAGPRHRAQRRLSSEPAVSQFYCSGYRLRDASSTSLESCKKHRLLGHVTQHGVVCL